jgi:hypothetical protein
MSLREVCGAPKQGRRRNKTPAELFDSAGASEACGAVRILRVYFPELGCPSFSKMSNKSLMAGLFFGKDCRRPLSMTQLEKYPPK